MAQDRQIRPAMPEDYHAILALARSVSEEPDAYTWDANASKEELASYWLPEPAKGVLTFVCEADSPHAPILGVYVLHPAASGRGSHVAHGAYMVESSQRGRGIGKLLCAHSVREARARGFLAMRINMVVATNTAAWRVCMSCGFKIMCTLPKVFRHGTRGLVDAHVMFLDLTEPVSRQGSREKPTRRFSTASIQSSLLSTTSGPLGPSGPTSTPSGSRPFGPPIAYPAASDGLNLCTEEKVRCEPKITFPGGRFTVEPPLPPGMTLDPVTGVISGAPTIPVAEQKYRVTASVSTEVSVQIQESPVKQPGRSAGRYSLPSQGSRLSFGPTSSPQLGEEMCVSINEAFASMVDNVVILADMPREPAKNRHYGDWMIWMVHRVHLNDPTLTELDFTNMHMPDPHVEKRIAPKLMHAIARNTHLETLALSNSNVLRAQGGELGQSLTTNTSLKVLNLECNALDSAAVREIALGIKANPGCRLEVLRLSHQKQMGQFFGRPTEEAVGQMMEKNELIVKLGFECDDAHWRNLIDRALLRNNDFFRRRSAPSGSEEMPTAEERTLSSIVFQQPPAAPAGEAPALHPAFRTYVVQNHKIPTTSQLQSCAKNSGAPLPYNVAAPLVKEGRAWMLDVAGGRQVSVTDAFGTVTVGLLRGWAETNDNWSLDILTEDGRRCAFRCNREPAFACSEGWASWLQNRRLSRGRSGA